MHQKRLVVHETGLKTHVCGYTGTGLADTGTGQVGGTHPKPVPMPQVRRVVCPSGRGPSRILSKGDGGCWKEKNPSVSHFEQGRGMGVVGRKRTPPSRISSEGGEGGGWKETAPSVSHFKRGRGGWLEGNGPLHLAFRAREGRGWLEGNGPLCLAFQAREVY
jgi:hypothetical protein